jgi:hypothetical protein
MKRIKLDYHELVVSDAAYELIERTAKANLVCGGCGHPYDKGFPQVILNLCLECAQKKYAHLRLTYAVEYETSDNGDVTYFFTDSEGYVYSTSTGSEHQPEKSPYYTLKHWHFPIPETVTRNGEEKQLNFWFWYIYGDVKKHSVLYIESDPRYSDEKGIGFLTTRDGECVEVNKRMKKFQKLWKRARERLEATRDENNEYHVGGHAVYGFYQSYINEMVSQIVSEEHEARK